MPEDPTTALEMEKLRIAEESRLREAELELERRKFEASLPRPEQVSWSRRLGGALVAALPLITAVIAPSFAIWQFGLAQDSAARQAAEARTYEARERAEAQRLDARKAYT